MQPVSTSTPSEGVRCSHYLVQAARPIPFVVLAPQTLREATPVVLTQHGGGGHKLAVEVMDLVDRFVVGHGWSVVAMDGPVHGDRRKDRHEDRPHVQGEFLAMWRAGGDHVEEMVQDWTRVIDELEGMAGLRADALHWVGVSMGTAYGLPLLAVERRIRSALIGMWGLSYPRSEVLGEAAARVECPVMFQQKWDDDIFSRDGQIALFDRIGCADKRLNVYPGKHVPVKGEQLDDIEQFILRRHAQAGNAAS